MTDVHLERSSGVLEVRWRVYTRLLRDGTWFTIHYWPSA